MKDILIKFFSFLAIPFWVLNMFGGVVAVVWLAILGEWSLIVFGIIGFFVGRYLIIALLLPAALILSPGAYFLRRGIMSGTYFFGFLGALYCTAVLTVWSLFVLDFFVQQVLPQSLFPILLWSYIIATAPILWLAKKDIQDSGGDQTIVITIFIQIAYVTAIILFLLSNLAISDVYIIFCIILLFGMIIQFLYTTATFRTSHYY